ncbi:MAG: DUF177 domain-containing protein [Leptolyngbya sp. SIO4C1]|nr:DUF177 domain-containing protein [Leptolyngbya sp. SIO4C1]
MQPIYIPHLQKAPDKTRIITIDESLPELETLTPIKGRLSVQHRGNFLEVAAQAETIMTLSCHRCLQNYNSRISVNTSEFIWLQEPELEAYGVEREVGIDDLIETLPPQGHFDPTAWLYEQFCLAIPQRQLCDQGCPGIAAEASSASSTAEALDHRWSALSALKQQLSD